MKKNALNACVSEKKVLSLHAEKIESRRKVTNTCDIRNGNLIQYNNDRSRQNHSGKD